MKQTIADAVRSMNPNKCYKCLSIDGTQCKLGKKCIHYNKENLDKEIERRRKEREK